MNPLIQLIFDPWFWVTVFVSVIGTVIVFLGHKIGADAEKLLLPTDFKEDIFGDIVKRYKAKMDLGHKIVMAGVVIEAICALAVCIISGLENAALNEKSSAANLEAKQAEKDAGDAKVLAANIGRTNTQLIATNLAFAKQLFDLSSQLQDTRNFVSESNTTARIREEKDAVTVANEIAQKAQDIASQIPIPKSRLISRDGEFKIIEKLELTKPMSVYIALDSFENESKKLGGELIWIFKWSHKNNVSDVTEMSGDIVSGIKITTKSSPDEN